MISMKEMIKEELIADFKENEFDTEDYYLPNGKKLIALTLGNVKRVEWMLRYNPDYPEFLDFEDLLKKDANKILECVIDEINDNSTLDFKKQKYEYPSIYYICALRSNELNEKNYRDLIYVILRKINAENNTRSSAKAIKIIKNRICKYDFTKLKEVLRKPCKDYYDLFKLIIKLCDKKHHVSLATKFCHYMNFILYYNTKYVNSFSIYDSVVRDNLPYYYNHYVEDSKQSLEERKYTCDSSEFKDLEDDEACNIIIEAYKEYQEIIDEILDSKNVNISRNGFDHLVWYTGKNKYKELENVDA